MEREAYERFTAELTTRLAADGRVVGLVALGSMAALDYQPDRWSDHDFFVITQPGEQEYFRTDLVWLPRSAEIVFWFRETEHGVKVVYADGHLLEFAVFDTQELALAGANRYRVLLDRGGIEAQMQSIARRTTERSRPTSDDDRHRLGMFLTNVLVGVGRHQRGERLSGIEFIKGYALAHLLTLLQRHVPSADKTVLDNLNPYRRFERVFPGLGVELETILAQDSLAAARGLLTLAERELKPYLPEWPSQAVAAIRRQVEAI